MKRREMTPKGLGASRVGNKNRVTLSPEVMKLLKLELGDYIAFVRSDGFVILKGRVGRTGDHKNPLDNSAVRKRT